MKIAYNPTGGSALSKSQIDSLKNDIIFDLSGMAVYARGIPVGKVYLPFEKSTSSTTEGYNGLVPFPDYNGNSKTRFLREDGTWVVPTNTNNYRPISINGTPILENNNTVLNLVAGNNITLSPKKDSNNKYTGEVTITANAIGIKDLSGTSFSTYLKSSITYGYNSDETKKDNIVGDFGIFNMQTSSYTESNHFYFRQFRGQAGIDKLYTRLYYKRENEDIKYTDWKEILKLGDYTTLAGYGITDAVKIATKSANVSESCVGYTTADHNLQNGGLFTGLGADGLYGSQLLGNYVGTGLYYRGKNNGDWTDWKELAFKATTLAGYGITDAVKLASFGQNGIDLNELDETGIWNGLQPINRPTGAYGYSSILNSAYQPDYQTQLYFDHHLGNVLKRNNKAGTWQEWNMLLDTANASSHVVDLTSDQTISGKKSFKMFYGNSSFNILNNVNSVIINYCETGGWDGGYMIKSGDKTMTTFGVHGANRKPYYAYVSLNGEVGNTNPSFKFYEGGKLTHKTLDVQESAHTNLVTNLNANMVGGYNSSVLFTCESGYGVDVNAPHRNKESGPLLYKISSNCTNIPSGCTDGVLVHFNSQGTDTAFQLVSNYVNTGLYYRSGNLHESSSWYLYNRAWKKLAFTDSNITGNAATATLASTVTVGSESSNTYRAIVVHNGNSLYSAGNKVLYNYSTGDVKATSFTGKLNGSLIGGAKGNIIYQSATDTTAFLANPSTNGYVLKFNTSTGLPYWASDNNTTYTLPLAASGTRGGILIGYSESGKNYAVKLASEKAYVYVPWTDTKVTLTNTTTNANYRVLLSNSANDNNTTEKARKSVHLTFNPQLLTLYTGNVEISGEIRTTTSGIHPKFRMWHDTTNDSLYILSGVNDGSSTSGTIHLSGINATDLSNLYLDAINTYVKGAMWVYGGLVSVNNNLIRLLPLSDANYIISTNANYNQPVKLIVCANDVLNIPEILLNTDNLYISGSVTASGEITAYSDRRLKSNIKPLENRGYIQPMTYIKDNKECIGFIAQDVLEKYPELVNDNSEYLSLNYLQYVAVLQALIIELEKRVKELENGTRKL